MNQNPLSRGLHPPSHAFSDLMPYRVREILLVSSAYDAYILEEDGPLTERLFTEYSELNLSWAPRLTHAPTTERALELLKERSFDLVLTTPRLANSTVVSFGHAVKTEHPRMPVVCLLFNESDLAQFPNGEAPEAIDRVFMWTGDARSLICAIKLTEDWKNVDHDTQTADVRVMIVVEDSVRHYSTFLSILYTELMTQAASLIAEGVNLMHKLVRMRARPKVLLATNFEEAQKYAQRYAGSLAAVISDVRFPRGGVVDKHAGFHLVEGLKKSHPELPILMQSAEPENRTRTHQLGAAYVDKTSSKLLRSIRRFLLEQLGFGPFVFRLPDGSEVARAEDVYEMEKVLRTLPAEALAYHAGANHFSRWLTARSMFDLGRDLRDRKLETFDDIESAREFLITFLKAARKSGQQGVLTEFSASATTDSLMMRLGTGSIGGKARGIAFVNRALYTPHFRDDPRLMEVNVPRSVLIGTDIFDRFMNNSGLLEEVLNLDDDGTVIERFLENEFDPAFLSQLEVAADVFEGPIAVRSSSLLEDQQFRPFSGIYSTYMLPNNHPDPAVRFRELCSAIKAVYASTYSQSARAYVRTTPYSIEEEKMGVVLQAMVGQPYGNRFYPHFAGVAMSHNYYPIGAQRAEEGIALVALGLGHMVVTGGATLRFSPSTPQVLPQFTSPRQMLQSSQREFYGLAMDRHEIDFFADPDSSLHLYSLQDAEDDATLAAVGSVYSADDNTIRDNLGQSGPRVVTFNNVLKWSAVPVADTLAELLEVVRDGMGCDVEIEFAVDMGDWGRSGDREPCLYVLQIRPLASHTLQTRVDFSEVDEEYILARTERALGHGIIETVADIVYVRPQSFDGSLTRQAAQQVGEVNQQLVDEGRPYMLVGPGRWGSSDPHLGVPVSWAQIAGARIIAETRFHDREVEPSQGTHFFQNVTSQGVGYLTLQVNERPNSSDESYVDLPWLDAQPAFQETELLRHVRLDEPLRVLLDGHRHRAVVLKPSARQLDPDLMTGDDRAPV